ncbi:MAG: hypothetical protein QME90_10445 [Thermodesulfobacteriota bacterium]|nr:hypothetical protein [Thermodesulfobacteriota bacterium]
MSQIVGKTIYVLEAGCSQHTGAPLLVDFLVKARLLMESERELVYKESFERIFKWVDNLRSASYYVELDLDNLEHIFSLADMLRQIGSKEGEQYFSDLRYLVMETLDRCQLRWEGKRIQPDNLYHQFVQNLGEINKQRKDQVSQTSGPFERDVIITFNYDVMLDYAIRFRGTEFDYCLGISPSPQGFKLLKLHGSTNWAYCRKCRHPLQIVKPSPIPSGHTLDPFLEEGYQINFKMVTNVLKNTPCENCKEIDVLEPIVIPPTWSKAIDKTLLVKVWEIAVKEIMNAFQIIVIGYSMPPTDTFFQYLLTLGLASNAKLNRVVVINKDASEDFKQRYEKVFARSLRDRGRLKFLGNVIFERFVMDHMMSVGGQLEWTHE